MNTCVNVILVMMASIIFSAFVGYGFFLCSLSQIFNGPVVSRVAAFLIGPPFTSNPAYLGQDKMQKLISKSGLVTSLSHVESLVSS